MIVPTTFLIIKHSNDYVRDCFNQYYRYHDDDNDDYDDDHSDDKKDLDEIFFVNCKKSTSLAIVLVLLMFITAIMSTYVKKVYYEMLRKVDIEYRKFALQETMGYTQENIVPTEMAADR